MMGLAVGLVRRLTHRPPTTYDGPDAEALATLWHRTKRLQADVDKLAADMGVTLPPRGGDR